VGGASEQLLQVRDETGALLLELLIDGAGGRLFLSTAEPALAGSRVQVTLLAESGGSARAELRLEGGLGEWALPSGFLPEGVCSVEAVVLEALALEPPANDAPGAPGAGLDC
jgi:hypothetical protein